jgi:hypothetical protein
VQTLGYPYQKGYFEPDDGSDQLPDQYFTYNLVGTATPTKADGLKTSSEYRMQVSFFTRDGSLLNTMPALIETALLAIGFTGGEWSDFPYDEETRHEGIHADFYYYERR